MRVFPENEPGDVISIGDYKPGICEGRVSKDDALELITAIRPWLGGKALEAVSVRATPEGVLYVQTDSRDTSGGLVRGVTIYNPARRPEGLTEATTFDKLMATLGRAAGYEEIETTATLVATHNNRSAA